MGKILPLLLIIFGIAGGGGAGFFLRPAPEPLAEDEVASGESGVEVDEKPKPKTDADGTEIEPAFVKLNNQFVVPVVSGENISALVVLSLTLETTPESTEMLYGLEPKIRDAALRELFNHAYAGGFDGQFTSPEKLDQLRSRLVDAVNQVASNVVEDVLIIDIIRQDT